MVRPTHNAGKQGLIFSIITVVQCSPVKLKNVVTPMLPESEQAEKRGELEYKLTGSACTDESPGWHCQCTFFTNRYILAQR